jgi:hypothetical protein
MVAIAAGAMVAAATAVVPPMVAVEELMAVAIAEAEDT